jgi:hypothetical protein
MTSSGFAYISNIILTITNHGQHINGEGNKCMILTVFNAMGLDVEKHFEIIIRAACSSEIKYIENPVYHDGQKIEMHDSLISLLKINSMLEMSVFERIEWHPDWMPFMMVLISSTPATEVNLYYHLDKRDKRDQISAKKVIFLYLNNSHFQGATYHGVSPITVADLLATLGSAETKEGVVISQFNCASPIQLLASRNGKTVSCDLNILKEILKEENIKKRKVPVNKKVLELFIYFIIL